MKLLETDTATQLIRKLACASIDGIRYDLVVVGVLNSGRGYVGTAWGFLILGVFFFAVMVPMNLISVVGLSAVWVVRSLGEFLTSVGLSLAGVTERLSNAE